MDVTTLMRCGSLERKARIVSRPRLLEVWILEHAEDKMKRWRPVLGPSTGVDNLSYNRGGHGNLLIKLLGMDQAEKLKARGNEMVARGKLDGAIEAYTEAITLEPGRAVYYTNRALCYRKKQDWEKVSDDCEKALSIDRSNVKAHYYQGLALLELKRYGEATVKLESALSMVRVGDGSLKPEKVIYSYRNGRSVGVGIGSSIAEDIWKQYARAKYLCWQEDAKRKRNALRDLRAKLAKMFGSTDHFNENESNLLNHVVDTSIARLSSKQEVPDKLCCPITMEVYREPVITLSGQSFECAPLLHHLDRNGELDPVTREPLKASDLRPNLALREICHSFLNDNPWAYGMYLEEKDQ